jgi:hypothetical protein
MRWGTHGLGFVVTMGLLGCHSCTGHGTQIDSAVVDLHAADQAGMDQDLATDLAAPDLAMVLADMTSSDLTSVDLVAAPDMTQISCAPVGSFGCTTTTSCWGYCVRTGWDPCRPQVCAGGTCGNGLTPAAVPDGTPCDDGNACSFAAPLTCASDADCAHGGTPVCVGGDNDGQSCTTNEDCRPTRAGPCRTTCVGGPNAGNPCNINLDCPSGTCSGAKVCALGVNVHQACTTNTDCDNLCKLTCTSGAFVGQVCNPVAGGGCVGGSPDPISACSGAKTCANNTKLSCMSDSDCGADYPDYAGYGISGCLGRCTGGQNLGRSCISRGDCGGGNCNLTIRKCYGGTQQQVCVGGAKNGRSCTVGADCPGGGVCPAVGCAVASECPSARCVKWSCDTTHGYCKGQDGIPFCNSLADCNSSPYNTYCARDLDWSVPWTAGGGHTYRCTSAVTGLECNTGGPDYGPCVTYSTCSASHQCLNSTDPCAGGPYGVGSICNNVCRSGVCSTDFTRCN